MVSLIFGSYNVLSWILKDKIKTKLCIAPPVKTQYVQVPKKKQKKKRRNDKLIDILLSLYKVVEQVGNFFLEWSVEDSMQNNKGSWARVKMNSLLK